MLISRGFQLCVSIIFKSFRSLHFTFCGRLFHNNAVEGKKELLNPELNFGKGIQHPLDLEECFLLIQVLPYMYVLAAESLCVFCGKYLNSRFPSIFVKLSPAQAPAWLSWLYFRFLQPSNIHPTSNQPPPQ